MSRVEYADPQAPAPSFGAPDTWEPRPSSPRATRAALASTIPLAISIVVFAIFITSYWVPETSRFAGRDSLLTQLSPLVSKYLTSAGQPLVDIQDNQLGVAGLLLLIFGSLIFWMARTRYWMARMWIWAPVLAGAAVCVATTAVLAIRNDLSRTSLSVMLMIIWVASAIAAAWLSMVVDVESLPPKSHGSGLLILAVFSVLGVPATAVGRLFFAGEVRQVAAELQNNAELQTAALGLPENALIYFSGVMVGVVAWLAYQVYPVRRDRRTAVLAGGLVGSLIFTLILGVFVTHPAAVNQVDRLRTESPRDDLRSCVSWIIDPTAEVNETVAIDETDCRRMIRYAGYLQQDLSYLPEPLSPINAKTPEGVQIQSDVVSARYDNMVVVATSTEGDSRASAVRGLQLSDGAQVWKWSCPDQSELTLRFAGVPTGDDTAKGYVTIAGEPRSVVVGCPQLIKHLDPRTGLGIP
jgi:uncharacterized protein YjeT (DUF2065 family)